MLKGRMSAMAETAKKKATYEDPYSVPENMTGEIIAGKLVFSSGDLLINMASGLQIEDIPFQLGRHGDLQIVSVIIGNQYPIAFGGNL